MLDQIVGQFETPVCKLTINYIRCIPFILILCILFIQVVYGRSIASGGHVFQIANGVWSRFFSDKLSTELGWSLLDDEPTENNPSKKRRSGHKGKQKEYTALRSFARDLTFLLFQIVRQRCVLSGRRVPATLLIIDAIREARKQAVTRFSRKTDGRPDPVDMEKFFDATSPSISYVTAGDMDDDLAQTPDALFDNHVSLKTMFCLVIKISC
jgi:hypothetical protein